MTSSPTHLPLRAHTTSYETLALDVEGPLPLLAHTAARSHRHRGVNQIGERDKRQMHDVGSGAAVRPGAMLTGPLDLIAAALRGMAPAYPRDPPPRFREHILAISAVHGVEALLDAALATSAASATWPVALRERLG